MLARHVGVCIGIAIGSWAAALALACAPSTSTSSGEAPGTEAPATPAQPAKLPLHLLNADGDPIAGIELGLSGTEASVTDAEGRVVIELPSWRAAAPVIHLRATLPGGDRLYAVVPREALAHQLTLQLPPGTGSDRLLTLVPDELQPELRAWFEVSIWFAEQGQAWAAASSTKDKLALWAEVARQIDAAPDPHTRALMHAAQFAIGRADPEAGLTRSEAAARALDELGLDDPRWAIWDGALATAVWESGRWEQLDELDDQIRDHPQPEVAAHVALERYIWAVREGRWSQAEEIWARWEARPELAETIYGPVVQAYGPTRRLSPGRMLPELCVEPLEPTEGSESDEPLCTADFEGLTLLEIYAVWCEGCRKSFPKLASIIASFAEDEFQPSLVTIEVYNDLDEVRGFLEEVPAPGRHGWVRADQREAVREALGLGGVPTMVLVGPDGRILDSTPHLSADNLAERLHHWRVRLASE